MLPQILPKDRFSEFVGQLMAAGRVVAPMAKGPQFAFEEVAADQISQIRMDYDISILPLKKFLLPQHETLFGFSGRPPGGETVEMPARATIILGAHPYDITAMATLDAAFAMDPSDPYYLAKRGATRIVGVNIQKYANDHQFMADMGSLEPPPGSFDLFLTDLGDRYFVEIGTAAGLEMARTIPLFAPARPEDHKAKLDYDARKAANCRRKLPYDTRYLPELLGSAYDSLLWDALARRCYGCGSCTNVCPTCYCFDVQDKLGIDVVSGTRQRKWDSCQLKPFSEVAGGENFREHRSSRLRHRVFRKGKYILERTGRSGCVGCGRCIYHCVAGISILEAFQQIADEAQIRA